jgi:hypothetical protein
MRFAPEECREGSDAQGIRKPSSPKVITMQYMEMMPVAVAAWRYSVAYMLCGGGVLGAIVVFVGAKMLGK